MLPLTLTALLLAVVTRQASRPISDPDSFWHLSLGHIIIASRSTETPEDWAAVGGRAWVVTQWLPEVVAAAIDDLFGLPGVAWLFGLSLVLLTLVVHHVCRREAGLTAAAFATALCVVGMSASLSPRPHMVTYIFLGITVGAWMNAVRDLRPRWWLIPLSWVWACSHGMWFTGVVTGFAVVAGLALDRQVSPRRLGLLALIPALSLIAAALTPVGPRLLLAPIAVGSVGGFIAEWQPPSFKTLGPAVTVLMIGMVVATWARRGRRVPWPHLLILGVSVGWTILAARTVTLGAVMVAPLTAAVVQSWLNREAEARTRRERVFLVTVACACLVVLGLVVPRTSSQPAGVPVDLDEKLTAVPTGSVVLNSYEVGGWLRWRHPSLQPFIDGLTEAYTTEHLLRYGRVTAVAEGWERVVAQSRATYAVVPDGSPLATALQDRLAADRIATGNGYVLLRLSGHNP